MAITIKDLLNQPNERFVAMLVENDELFSLLDVSVDEHSKKLIEAVKYNLSFMKKLPIYLQTDQILEAYLNKILIETDSKTTNYVTTSFDNKTSLKLAFSIMLDYIDTFIGVPATFQIDIELKLKIVSASKFLSSIDLGVEHLNLKNIYDYFTSFLSAEIKVIISSFLTEKKVGYFELPVHFSEIAAKIKEGVDSNQQGLSVQHCLITDIKIPNLIKEMVTEGYFSNRQKEIMEKHQQDKEKHAMMMYKEKAIITKETGFPVSLTETEKDKAIDRYIKRLNALPNKEEHKTVYKKETMVPITPDTFKKVEEKELPRDIKPYRPLLKPTPFIIISVVLSLLVGLIYYMYAGKNLQLSAILMLTSLILTTLTSLLYVSKINIKRG